MFDQDAYLVIGMQMVSEARAEKENKNAARQKAEAEATVKKAKR